LTSLIIRNPEYITDRKTHFKNMFHTSDIGKTDTRPSAGLYSPLISWSLW